MIYLIKSYLKGDKYIYKIGYSSERNIENRLGSYFYHAPGNEVISVRKGEMILENMLHFYLYSLGLQFKKNGKLDEWFVPDSRILQIFHISQDSLEEKLWKNRNKYFNSSNITNKTSLEKIIFTHLYNKHKRGFIGKKFIIKDCKVIKTRAKDIDIKYQKVLDQDATISLEDVTNDIIRKFLTKFISTGLFPEKLKMYCEFMDTYQDNKYLTDAVTFKIGDSRYRDYYNFYGTSGCSAKGFQEYKLKPGIMDSSEEDRLKAAICVEFKSGERYTMKELKIKLAGIYKKLGITKTAKAKDLEKYVKLSRTRITLPDKSVENGFKIL